MTEGPSYLLIGIQQNHLDTVHCTLSVHRQLMDVLFLHTKLLLQQIASYLQNGEFVAGVVFTPS